MVAGVLAAGFSASAPQTAHGEPTPPDLASLPLDQLMNIQVTSVSKRAERLGDTAAAIFVITQEDIRRSGLTALPDILRLAPGVDVAQSDANHWAVSIRGNNGIYSAKLLVLVDGRSIYSPLFSGVFWGVQSVVIQDIERIEVIRGTGGAVWGANAMNGVINIITKPAGETQGLMVAATTGSDLKGELTARYGGQIAGNASYRVFVKGFDHDGLVTATGADAGDAASQINGGFRLDWSPSTADAVSLQGEVYADAAHARLLLPTIGSAPTVTPVIEHNSGGHGLVNWQHILSETSDVTVQAYFDRANTEEITSADRDDTFDIDVRHHFIAARNDIVWGGGYRYISSNTGTSPLVNFGQTSVQQRIANVFAQGRDHPRADREGDRRIEAGGQQLHWPGARTDPAGRLVALARPDAVDGCFPRGPDARRRRAPDRGGNRRFPRPSADHYRGIRQSRPDLGEHDIPRRRLSRRRAVESECRCRCLLQPLFRPRRRGATGPLPVVHPVAAAHRDSPAVQQRG